MNKTSDTDIYSKVREKINHVLGRKEKKYLVKKEKEYNDHTSYQAEQIFYVEEQKRKRI
jgi:hypothetical protein